MTLLIETWYQHVLLADAAYVDPNLPPDQFRDQLRQRQFTEKQIEEFTRRYIPVPLSTFNNSGFSATIFEDRDTNQQILAIRGTEANTIGDLLADFDIALFGQATGQYAALKEFIRTQRANGTLKDTFTVTGHSLGGHLAVRLHLDETFKSDPDINITIEHTYTYNGPGLGFGLDSGFLSVGALFIELAERFLGQNFDKPIEGITNLYGSAGLELAAGAGVMFGTTYPIYIQDDNTGFAGLLGVENHFIRHLTDSLSVYRILDRLSPITEGPDFKKIHDILAATSIEQTTTHQFMLEDIGALFDIPEANTSTEKTDEFLDDLNKKLEAFPTVSRFDIGTLVETSAADLAQQANRDDVTGLAYRYALLNLDAFVVQTIGADGSLDVAATQQLYSPHNVQDELAKSEFSERFLEDRARFLFEKLKQGDTRFDFFSDSTRTIRDTSETLRLVDLEEGLEFRLLEPPEDPGRPTTPIAPRITFGSLADDSGDSINGARRDDRIYGRDGDDFIDGKEGQDYIEGNRGSDTLIGGHGEDELVGGAGDDALIGGIGLGIDDNARDILRGGVGVDIYDVGNNDVVIDEDHLGSVIFRGAPIPLTNLAPVNGMPDLFSNHDLIDPTRYRLLPDGSLQVIGSFFTIRDFDNGDFGINLDGLLPPPELNVIQGTEFDDRTGGTGGIGPLIGTPDADEIHGLGGDDDIGGAGGNDVLFGEGGNDFIVSDNGNDVIDAGDGRDAVTASGGKDLILGGGGDDFLSSGDGDDYLDGGDFNDFLAGGAGEDALEGGAGNDVLIGDGTFVALDRGWSVTVIGNASGGVSVSIDQALGDFESADDQGDTLNAGAGDDVLFGGGGNDQLFGEDGNDVLQGDSGDDHLDGGEGIDELQGDNSSDRSIVGHDVLVGGAGDDFLVGGFGDDDLAGGAGNDEIHGDYLDTPDVGGNDRISAGDGNDVIIAGAGDDDIEGGAGNDQIDAGAGRDIINGGDDADTVTAGAGNDTVFGGRGADTVNGDAGDDFIHGGEDNDFLFGDDGLDEIDGGAGNDQLSGGADADTLRGGGGNDLLDGGDDDDALFGDDGDDQLQGGAGNDTLDGGTGNDALIGQDGDDTLQGGFGDDNLQGNAGNDLINGDGGNDFLFGQDGADVLSGGAGLDEIRGGNDNDILSGGADRDLLFGDAGDDSLDGGDGDDNLQGGFGNDSLSGGSGSDALFGEDGVDFLNGGAGDDQLQGGTGIDTLAGDAGNDTLFGDSDNDSLHGGTGNDILVGGGGDDVYLFDLGDERDVITEQADTQGDLLRFGDGISPGDILVTKAGKNLVASHVNGTDSVTVNGWFTDDALKLNRFEFADGSAWDVPTITSRLPDSLLLRDGDVVTGNPGPSTYRLDVTVPDGFQITLNDSGGNDRLDLSRTLYNTSPVFLFRTPVLDGLTRSGNNLILSLTVDDDNARVVDAKGTITIENYYTGSGFIETIEFSDGVILNSPNNAPIVNGAIADQIIDTDAPYVFPLPGNFFTDDVLDLLSFNATLVDGSPLPGWLSFDPATLTFSGTPAVADKALLDIEVRATDRSGAIASDRFLLNAGNVNQAPRAGPDAFSTAEDSTLIISAADLLANDSDPNGDVLTVTAVGNADNGAVSLDLNGDVVFTPAADFNGDASFDYTVDDGSGGTDIGAVTVEVTPVNDPPVANPDAATVILDEITPNPGGGGVIPGDAFLVNTTTDGSDYSPAVGGLADGGFVAIWARFDTAWNLLGQRFDAQGRKDGDEFIAIENWSPSSLDIDVAGLQNGGFVVTWDGGFAQLFDSNGNKIGDQFLANESGGFFPRVTGLSNGGFVVTSHGPANALGDVLGISAQIFDADGLKVGNEFLVNTYTRDIEESPDIAALANGGFVISWASERPPNRSFAFMSRIFNSWEIDDATGELILDSSGEIIADPDDTSNTEDTLGSVAGLTSGGFVVAWENSSQLTSHVQIYNASGDKVGNQFQLPISSFRFQERPRVVGLPDGGFAVTWAAENDSSDRFILTQQYDFQGNAVGDLVGNSLGRRIYPDVTSLNNGGFVVTWRTLDGTTGQDDIAARIFQDPSAVIGTNSVLVNVLANDSDIDAGDDPSTFTLDSVAVQGTLGQAQIVGNQLLFEAGTDFDFLGPTDTATVLVDYSMSDSGGAASSSTATITVSQNVPPAANPDTAELFLETDPLRDLAANVITVDVLANDTDLDPNENLAAFVLDSVSLQGTKGQVSIVNKELVFDARADFDLLGVGESEDVVVDYTVTDDGGASASSTATITVRANRAPIAIPDEVGLTATPDGPDEFLVNSFTESVQLTPVIATQPDGSFLVVWWTSRVVQIGAEIVGQLFDNSGNATGDVLHLFSARIDWLAVAALKDGGYAVAHSLPVPHMSRVGQVVEIQIIDSQGSVIGDPIWLGVPDQTNARVKLASLSDGGFVAVWENGGQRFDANGNPTTTSPITTLWDPNVAATSDGGFYVVTSDNSASGDVFGQHFDASGAAGPLIKISNEVNGSLTANPQVTTLVNGNIVVTWTETQAEALGPPFFGNDILGQLLSPDGAKIGSNFLINSNTNGDQEFSSIAPLPDGGFVAVWASDGDAEQTLGREIVGQRFDAGGTAVGAPFLVNTFSAGEQTWPSVASRPDGSIVVTWQTDDPTAGDDSASGISARIISFEGSGTFGGSITVDVLANDSDPDPNDGPGTLTLESVSLRGDFGAANIVDNKLEFSTGADSVELGPGIAETVVVDYVVSDDGGAKSASTATIHIHDDLTLVGTEGDDTIEVTDTQPAATTLGGNDAINIAASTNDVTVNAGPGNDLINFSGRTNATINTGSGNNQVNVTFSSPRSTNITTGNGSNLISFAFPTFGDPLLGLANAVVGGGSGPNSYALNNYLGANTSARVAINDRSGGGSYGAGRGRNRLTFGSSFSRNITMSFGSLQINIEDSELKVILENFDPNDVINGPRDIDFFEFTDGSVLTYEQFVRRGFDIDGTDVGDTLSGTNITDRINGLAGNDIISTGDGDDLIIGGLGDDTLDGGQGNDLYAFSLDEGNDTVADSEGTDQIIFNEGIDADALDVTRSGNDLSIAISPGNGITIQNWFEDQDNQIEKFIFNSDPVTLLNASEMEALINLPPVVAAGIDDLSTDEDQLFQFTVPSDAFFDPNANDVLAFSAVLADTTSLPSWLSFAPDTRRFYGTPTNDDVGEVTIEVTVEDRKGETASDAFSLTVVNVNDPPSAVDDEATTDEDSSVVIADPTSNDIDIDVGDSLFVSSIDATGAAGGAVTLNADRTVSYDPGHSFQFLSPGEQAGDSFGYVAADGNGGFSEATVFITVTGVNDAPFLNRPIEDQVTQEGANFSLVLAPDTFEDVDTSDSLSFSASLGDGSPLPSWLSFDPITLSFDGIPTFDSAGNYAIRVEAKDLLEEFAEDFFDLKVINVINGTDKSDSLTGTSAEDIINGLGKNDTLFGDGGNDSLFGNDGNDYLHGDIGDDQLAGGLDNDSLWGEAGNDLLTGGDGNDVLNGGIGNDHLLGNAGNDKLDGGAGNDVLKGGDGNDTYMLGTGWGSDSIVENDLNEGNIDTAEFGSGIVPLDLVLRQSSSDLLLSRAGSGDRVAVTSWYVGTAHQVEQVRTSNGSLLLNTQVDRLIQAMATFTADTGLSWEEGITQRPEDVETILAAHWQS